LERTAVVKYTAQVTQIGPLVSEFIDHGILVLFGADAPEELAEFSVLHDGETLQSPVQPGDEVLLGGETFKVLAVGDVANNNLESLGHLILKFNGQTKVEMPGDICLEAKPLPPVKVGMQLTIQDG
jgi:PTS system glucitol/sorbitol-specific IIA component